MVTTQGGQGSGNERFTWHPDYAGQTREAVTRQLTDDLERDQRAYNLALENAEKAEHSALNSILDLEKRWGSYHFSWQETDPHELAASIAEFEWAREQKQELFSWNVWRSSGQAQRVSVRPTSDAGSTGGGQFPMNIGLAVGAVALIALLFLFLNIL